MLTLDNREMPVLAQLLLLLWSSGFGPSFKPIGLPSLRSILVLERFLSRWYWLRSSSCQVIDPCDHTLGLVDAWPRRSSCLLSRSPHEYSLTFSRRLLRVQVLCVCANTLQLRVLVCCSIYITTIHTFVAICVNMCEQSVQDCQKINSLITQHIILLTILG